MKAYRRNGTLPSIGAFALALVLFLWSLYYGIQYIAPHWQHDSSSAKIQNEALTDEWEHDFSVDVSSIVDAHIFGTPPPPEVDPQEAPETNLQINLLGLVASANDKVSRAIIAVDGSKVKPYSIGQTIDGTDASVHAVETKRILLKRGDAIESLPLKRKGSITTGNPDAGTSNDAGDGSPATAERTESAQVDKMRERARNVQIRQPF